MEHLARKLERSSRVKESISFFSHKMKSVQYCESRLEVQACLQREFNPKVSSYLTQPSSIFYKVDGKRRRYTPDALVKTSDNRFYFEEVKPQIAVASTEFQIKFSRLQRLFEDTIKQPLVVNTVTSGQRSPAITNMEYLYGFRAKQVSPEHSNIFLSALPCTRIELGDARELCAELSLEETLTFQLLAHQKLKFDMSKKLTNDTVLEVTHDSIK